MCHFAKKKKTQMNLFSISHRHTLLAKEYSKLRHEYHNKELTILAVKISFPRRAKRPRPSDDALRCDSQMSPSISIPYQIKTRHNEMELMLNINNAIKTSISDKIFVP